MKNNFPFVWSVGSFQAEIFLAEFITKDFRSDDFIFPLSVRLPENFLPPPQGRTRLEGQWDGSKILVSKFSCPQKDRSSLRRSLYPPTGFAEKRTPEEELLIREGALVSFGPEMRPEGVVHFGLAIDVERCEDALRGIYAKVEIRQSLRTAEQIDTIHQQALNLGGEEIAGFGQIEDKDRQIRTLLNLRCIPDGLALFAEKYSVTLAAQVHRF